MSNITSLVKKIDTLLALVEEKQRSLAAATERVVIQLPVKDNEPPVAYRRGDIVFYVPQERMNQSA